MIITMHKLKIIIAGEKVHNVGYRSILINKALELGINHFNTFNVSINGLQAVVILIEGDSEQLDEFMGLVRTKQPERAVVSKITDEGYSKAVPPIERCIQSFQMGQWGKGIPLLLDIRDILQSVKEDTGKMLEKQDTTIEILKSVKEDTSKIREDTSKIKEDTSRIPEIAENTSRTNVLIEERFDNLQSEIERIKRALEREGITV